jgi:glycosyltransferase involved in cell wall biosynthesis
MAAGLPVVVSDRTSLPEVTARAGLIAPASDAAAWADALSRALDPSGRTTLVAAGKEHEDAFGWARSARLVSSLLAGIVGT